MVDEMDGLEAMLDDVVAAQDAVRREIVRTGLRLGTAICPACGSFSLQYEVWLRRERWVARCDCGVGWQARAPAEVLEIPLPRLEGSP